MKKNWILYTICSLFVFLASCQKDDELNNGGATGYLRLTIAEDASTTTRAVPEDYNAKQIAVQIVDATGKVAEETDDWETWKDTRIELAVGTYTIKASSNGFDGKDAGFDIPYYAGSEKIEIKAGSELNETVTCTLANVKVSVNFDAELVGKVESIAATVDNDENPEDGTPAVYSLDFVSTEKRSAYFPVTQLYASISVRNKEGKTNSIRQKLTDEEGNPVKARDHFILNIKEAESTEGSLNNVTITVNPTTHEYSYTFYVSTEPKNNATMSAGAWDRLAYLMAENVSTGTGVSPEGMKFQYREKVVVATQTDESTTPWHDVETTSAGNNKYTAMLTGLTAEKEYEYRLVNGESVVIGSVSTFTTDATDAKEGLQNAGFEDWYKAGAVWYAASQSIYDAGNYMWDTSNPGSGSFGFNPTSQSTDVKHGDKSAAKLETQYAYIKLAAASLYYGRFNTLVGMSGAKIDFGQAFASRPVSFKGWYQYTPVAIDNVGKNQPANTVGEGDPDQCSIFIILSKGTYQVNNTDVSTLLTAENVWNNDQFIAYGELPAEQCKATDGWVNFDIPLQYKEGKFGEQPTHLIIVCSSSKYGDYFTGGEGSTMYLDDFSLNYEGTPAIWNFESGAAEE